MKGSGLSFDELRTDIIYSFLNQLLTISEELDCPRVVFVWDSKRNYRKRKYSWYKNRPTVEDEEVQEIYNAVYPQFSTIRRRIVPSLGFKNNFIVSGFEADDLMASIVQNNPGYEFVIATRDNDILQLLDKKCSIYDYQSKRMKTEDTFEKEWGIKPGQWSEIKSIAGCVSDTVPGVYRVGEKTASAYIRGDLKKTHKTYKAIISNKEIIDRNRPIVKLPYEGTPVIKLKNNWKLDYVNFYAVFEEYGMNSFMTTDSIYRWQRAFNVWG
jgi:5'-3' exonuclease